ncbi:hypothetical protein HB364_18765 [Pseudoflavitalea sp. X16]|uniref:hypothetical protein n=1 Tax=Paraflavitalea devenefica TaxID=2716334 RepID=UPI00142381F0|nr:hypothetical protein [Paraflavitalea devenefica]NII27137.1 hypothetical protein [Paraflavitalea devenefica]
MRFLVPIVMLLVTSILMSREPQAPTAEGETVWPAYTVETAETAEAAEANAEYDEIIEASGMLNRLELLDF